MEEEISLVELFSILRKRLGMIIGLSFLGLLLSFIMTFYVVTPQYSSTTKMVVTKIESSVPSFDAGGIDTNVKLIYTYKDIIEDRIILDDVREELSLDLTHGQLVNKFQIKNDPSSQVFSLTVTDDTPERAAEIANKVVEVFQEKVITIMGVDNVSALSAAIPVEAPISPNKILNLAIGLLLGLMTAIGLAFVLEFLDTTVKDTKFVTDKVGWTNLGSISVMTTEELMLEAKAPERDGPNSQTRRRV